MGKTVSTEGLPCLSERLNIEEYREQQRTARDEKLARRAQENADDQKMKDRAREKSCSGRHRSTEGGASPSSSIVRVYPRRRQSASASLGGHQPRPRKKLCGRASCVWTPFAVRIARVACPGEVLLAATHALCAACHRGLPEGKVTHLGLERQERAHAFVQRCLAEGESLPKVVVRNYNPNGGCLCLREDCFHSFFSDDDRKADVPRRCATCNQKIKQGK